MNLSWVQISSKPGETVKGYPTVFMATRFGRNIKTETNQIFVVGHKYNTTLVARILKELCLLEIN